MIKRKLYQIETVLLTGRKTFFIVASDPTTAEIFIRDTLLRYKYALQYIESINIMAEEGQYGKPEELIILVTAQQSAPADAGHGKDRASPAATPGLKKEGE